MNIFISKKTVSLIISDMKTIAAFVHDYIASTDAVRKEKQSCVHSVYRVTDFIDEVASVTSGVCEEIERLKSLLERKSMEHDQLMCAMMGTVYGADLDIGNTPEESEEMTQKAVRFISAMNGELMNYRANEEIPFGAPESDDELLPFGKPSTDERLEKLESAVFRRRYLDAGAPQGFINIPDCKPSCDCFLCQMMGGARNGK